MHGTTAPCGPWPPSKDVSIFCNTHSMQLWGLLYINVFTRWGCQPLTWRTRVSVSVWHITFDLSGMGDPPCSCATAEQFSGFFEHIKVGYHRGGEGKGSPSFVSPSTELYCPYQTLISSTIWQMRSTVCLIHWLATSAPHYSVCLNQLPEDAQHYSGHVGSLAASA